LAEKTQCGVETNKGYAKYSPYNKIKIAGQKAKQKRFPLDYLVK
jgi:hypothetical protein